MAVWSARVRPERELLDAPLSGPERGRAARMMQPFDRARHLSGRALLRWAVADVLGVDAHSVVLSAPGPGRRPTVQGEAIGVSLAHSGGVVLVAASPDAEVGVDVERMVRVSRSRSLQRWLPDVEEPRGGWDADRMTVSWVRREAVLKATGRGLTVPRGALSLSRADEAARVSATWAPLPPASAWALADLPAPDGYRAAVAVVSGGPPGHGTTSLAVVHRCVPPAWQLGPGDASAAT